MLPELTTLNQIAEAIEAAKVQNKFLLLKFGATWCKPCKQIAPIAERVVKLNSDNLMGFEVDVDVVVESLVQFKVSKLPTFILIKDGNVVNTWTGSDPQQLKNNFYNALDAQKK
jgi:thioredoxin 1